MLERLEEYEKRWGPVLLTIAVVLLSASLVFFFFEPDTSLRTPDSSLRTRGAVILLAGVIVTVLLSHISAQPLTTKRLMEILKEERKSKRFYLRLLGFAIALLGTLIIFYSEAASFLELILVIIVMTNLFFYNVLRLGSK